MGVPADPDKLEAAIVVGEDVQQALVITGPELGLLVGHAEQVGVQLWEGCRQSGSGEPGVAAETPVPGEGRRGEEGRRPPAASAGHCWCGGRTPPGCGPHCLR